MASGHRWNMAGDALLHRVKARYADPDGTAHLPTVVAATACLAGEAALMAHESHLPDAGTIDSRKVSDFVHDGAIRTRTLWGYAAMVATQAYGLEEDALPDYKAMRLRQGVRLLPGGYPALDLPPHLIPREGPMNAGPHLRRAIHETARAEGVQGVDIAFALVTAAMKTIGAAQSLGLRDLTALVLQCCVAGSRFVPLVEPVALDKLHLSAPAPSERDEESASAMVAAMLG